MYRLSTILLALSLLSAATASAQTDADPTPALEFVMDIEAELHAPTISLGDVPQGSRTIVPITGGTFAGPDIRGIVMAGGADYQMQERGRSRLHAIYTIRTDDGTDILVDNKGIISSYGGGYFFTTPQFEAPVQSPYSWLNDAIYVCRPVGGSEGSIKLRVWRVVDKH